MGNTSHSQFELSDTVECVSKKIVEMLAPRSIYLYNQRIGACGQTSGFKLCVILSTQDKAKVERDIYLHIDCEIPFDVIIYTPEEWEALASRPDSFACKIKQTGKVVYE